MALFQVDRILSLPHRSCTHVLVLLMILFLPPLPSSSYAKSCKCSSSDQDQRIRTTLNTTFDQISGYVVLANSSNSSSDNFSQAYYSLDYFKDTSQEFNLSDDAYFLMHPQINLWEHNNGDGTDLHEASFTISFTMSIYRYSNQLKVGSLFFGFLPPFSISPDGKPTDSLESDPFSTSSTIDDKTQVSLSITVWIEYDRVGRQLFVYVADARKPKPENPIATIRRAISDITSVFGTSLAFFSWMGQLLQLHTWNSTVELLPGYSYSKWATATTVGVVLGSAVAMGAVVATIVYFYFNSKYRRWKKDLDQLARSMQTLPGVPIKVNFSAIQKATNNFHETMKLGRGGFGAVYRCSLPAPVNGEAMEVAVKRFTRDHNRRYDDFLAEVSVINRLRHKNIVPLIGWSYNKGEPLLIYEYMRNGSLDQHLFRCGDQQQNNPIRQWDTRYSIVMDVSTGLHYVHHEYEPTVLHRDIKASNIMIDSTVQGRLGDFGLACAVDIGKNSYTTDNILGTHGFIAHEYLHSRRATRKKDIFSFGVLILEIVTGKPSLGRYAHFGHITDWVWHLHREGKLLDAVDCVVTTEQFDGGDARRLLLLGLACSSPNPSERPSMMEALQVITKLSPPPDVPLEKPRFVWPPVLEEDSSTSRDAGFIGSTQ